MTRILTTLLLLLAFALCIQAQKKGVWASARARGLKGVVKTVESKCSDINGKYETRYKFEFARDGKLMAITAPQFDLPDCIVSLPVSYKIMKRNTRGDMEEIGKFVEGDLMEKERYEYEYDSAGNWTKQVTFVTRTYEMAGGDWPAGEWRARYVCNRAIEYYP